MLLATLWDGFDLFLFFICLSPLENGQVTQKQKVHNINEINDCDNTNSTLWTRIVRETLQLINDRHDTIVNSGGTHADLIIELCKIQLVPDISLQVLPNPKQQLSAHAKFSKQKAKLKHTL